MRNTKFLIVLLALSLAASSAWGQRRKQIELYAGAAFPMSPDLFKEYTKVGLSGNAQYVLFPSPRLGITFNVGYEFFSVDNAKFVDAVSTANTGQPASYWAAQVYNTPQGQVRINPSADISSNLTRLGAGIRPYLTNPEASTQFFLLGQANYNLITNNFNVTELPTAYDATLGFLNWVTLKDTEYEEQIGENDESAFGVGLGGGLEIPAGSSFNIVVQGLFNILFTKDESTSFVGVTAGVVF